MTRWGLGLLVAAFFAGTAFILTTIAQNIWRVHRHLTGPAPLGIAMAAGALAGLIAFVCWARATRAD